MTYTYHYQKCTACNACLLADASECWYCGGEELTEAMVEWTVLEQVSE